MSRRFLLSICMLLTARGFAQEANSKAIDEIVKTWQTSSERLGRIELQWQRSFDDESDKLSRYEAFWASEDGNRRSSVSKLQTDGKRFCFESQRWTFGRHARDEVQNSRPPSSPLLYSALVSRLQRTNDIEFSAALSGKLSDPLLELGGPQPFTRVLDGKQWIDRWHKTDSAYGRATLRDTYQRGSVAWARLTPEENIDDQIDTLNHQAALLSLRHVQSPAVGINVNSLRFLDERQWVAGRSCFVLEEREEGSPHFRTFWVDAENDFIIRRFLGKIELPDQQPDAGYADVLPRLFGDTLIEIEYEQNSEFGWIPRSWIAVNKETAQHPVQDFTRSVVTSISHAEADLNGPIDKQREIDQSGVWVIDEPGDVQYLVLENGQKRPLTEDETEVGAGYEELTASGAELLGSELANRPTTSTRWAIAIAGLALCMVGARLRLRRRQQRRRLPTEAAEPASAE